jgi:hypothetical protein
MVRLLADLVVGVGDLRRQPHRRLENPLRFFAQLLPGDFIAAPAQHSHAFLELGHAGVMGGQIAADFAGNLLQLADDRFGPFQFAPRPSLFEIGLPASPIPHEVSQERDDRQSKGGRNSEEPGSHDVFLLKMDRSSEPGAKASRKSIRMNSVVIS